MRHRCSGNAQAAAQTAPSDAGFSLIEALIAILVLVFGLMAVTNLFVVAGSSNTVANQGTAATTMATRKMEQLKSITFQDLLPGGDINADVAGYNEDTTIPGVGVIHTRWAVDRLPGDAQTYFVTVRSEGQGVLARQRSRAELTTFRACTTTAALCPAP